MGVGKGAMFPVLVLLLFVVPLAEIWLLLTAGSAFGALPVIAACVATALVGGLILRLQGLAALDAARRDLSAGRAPVDAAVDGVFLLVAAPLLMTPGFITDSMGFLMLVPPVRRWAGRRALSEVKRRMDLRAGVIDLRRE